MINGIWGGSVYVFVFMFNARLNKWHKEQHYEDHVFKIWSMLLEPWAFFPLILCQLELLDYLLLLLLLFFAHRQAWGGRIKTDFKLYSVTFKKRKASSPECESILGRINQFSRSVVSESLWPHGVQHSRHSFHHQLPGSCSNSFPLSHWCHPTISSSVIPFSSCFQSFLARDLFQWVSSSHQVAKVLEFQHQSFQWIFRTDLL